MKNKWVVWLIVIVVVLCLLGILIGGGVLFFTQQQQSAETAQAPLPVVQIFFPPNMAEVPFGSVIPIGAEAFVPDGNQVTILELWADGELVGRMNGDSVALTASWGWTPAHASEHTLVARAYNQEGGEGTAAINLEVRRDLPDGDQDGIADEEDDCPDEIGAPEWNGCPPSGAGEIGDAWGPGGGNLAEEILEAIEDALHGEDPSGEEPPSEDPPVIIPEEDPPPPPTMALVEVEALELISAIGAKDVYCYLTLTSYAVERVPTDAEGNFSEMIPGNWNVTDFLGGDRGRLVDLPEADPLHFELDCWGHFSNDPLEPDVRHMGIVSVDHPEADWDGRELMAHGEIDANWFDIKYRICRGECEATTLPPPFGLMLMDMGGHYELRWLWDGDPSVDNSDVGFHVYRDGIIIATVPDNNPINVIALLPAEVEPPLCNQEYRFEVRAVRGANVQLSSPSNIAWSISPDPCFGDNRVAVRITFPIQNSALWLELEHFYILSHTERVVVGAYPLIDSAPVSAFLFNWNGTSVGAGGGVTNSLISYGGTEPITTNGLRLFMLTVADGVNPGGDMIYERDVAFDFTWQPGVPDLKIGHMYYPEGDDILRVVVRNQGGKPLDNWEPTFAFFQDVGGVRTRVDALNSPPGLGPVTIQPNYSKIVSWPGWTPAQFALLEPIFEVEVDPDNLIPEFSEDNNIFYASKPNVQVAIETLRVLSYGANDAAGFGGCFTGLTGSISTNGESLYFNSTGEKKTFPTYFDYYFPHEIGVMMCPPMEIDVETELISALNAGSCTSACSNYFTAHGLPIFAEGDHTPWWIPPIPAWGTDYCSACYTLAGQTTVNRDSQILDIPYGGGNLTIHIDLDDRDILGDGSKPSHSICNFSGVIPAADMAALPVMNRTLTDPGGACEIVVSVEPFP
jgi:hypothetical protein